MDKARPTIPDGDLGFDAIAYAREIVSYPSHHDADEFSACARETLAAMLAAWDRLRARHDTLFREHAFLMATKIPPTVISIPAPPADAATEAVLREAVESLPVHEIICHDDYDEDTGEVRSHDEHPSDCKACLWLERARLALSAPAVAATKEK